MKNTLAPAISPFVILFLLCALMFELFLAAGFPGFPYFLLLVLLAAGCFSVADAWIDYPENVVYAKRFKVVLNDAAMTVTQPVLWRERWRAMHQYRGGRLSFRHIGEVVAEPTATIGYEDVASVRIERGAWDRLFGLYKVVIALKDVQYSTFNPPVSGVLGQDVLGDSVAVLTLVPFPSPLVVMQGRIVVIPGLSKETAQTVREKIASLVRADGKNILPQAFSWFSVIIGVAVALAITLIIVFLFNGPSITFNFLRLITNTG